jgi:cytochrome c-type biogenesis protein CcmH
MTQEELDAAAAELAAQLRCPVCRNQSVLESSAELSQEMAALVKERLAMGESPEEVKDYFVSRYGEWILLEPQARGWNWLVWILPVVALLGGAVVAWILLRRWSSAGEARDPAPAPGGGEEAILDPESERWLRDALRDG